MTQAAHMRRGCTRCSRPLPAPESTVAPYMAATCGTCGYRNAVGVTHALPLPLDDMLQRLGLDSGALLDGSGGAAALFERCLRAMTGPIGALIGTDSALHAAATRLALEAHVSEDATPEREPGEQTIYRSASGRVLSILYLETVRRAAFDIDEVTDAGQQPRAVEYWRALQGPLSDIATLGSYWLACKQGLHQTTVEGGAVVLAPTRVGLAYAEWAWNRPKPRLDENDATWLKAIAQAIARFRGFGPLDPIRCVGRRRAQRRPLWLSAADHAPTDVRALEGHSLTLERVETLSWPWFYDLAPRRVPRTAEERLFSAATHNWLAYYPFLRTRSRGHDGFLTFDLWMDVFTNNLLSSKSRLLEEMCHQADEAAEGEPGKAELRRLRRTLNTLLEEQVATVVEQAGWRARAAQTYRAGGAKEEIDVLAMSSTAPGGVVLVIEAKDYDFRLSSARGPESMQDRADGAQAQALRKAAFVRTHPRVLRDAFPGAADVASAVVLPLIVTREELPLAMFGRVHAVAVNALSNLLEDRPDTQPLLTDLLRKGER